MTELERQKSDSAASEDIWNHDTHEEFYRHYIHESTQPETRMRFETVRDRIIQLVNSYREPTQLDVVDIGCGPGVQAIMWAKQGHKVHGLDVNRPLITFAQERAREAGVDIEFQVGTAVNLPWNDSSIDVCLVPELLEHVADWRTCLDEFTRILRPGGILYLSTSSKLCPIQQEFRLPLYS